MVAVSDIEVLKANNVLNNKGNERDLEHLVSSIDMASRYQTPSEAIPYSKPEIADIRKKYAALEADRESS
jgi:hypothetical protein